MAGPIIRRVSAVGTLCLLLASCGGGGGGGSGDPFNVNGGNSNAPCIFAEQFDFKPGSTPAGFNTGTLVAVLDNSCVNPIPNASVTMNGVTLPYNSTNQDYEGNVTIGQGGSVNLKVVVNGATFTASGTQFNAFPTISAPPPTGTWASLLANSLSWSGGAPVANALYGIGVLDASNPNGNLLWPSSQSLLLAPTGTTSATVPPGGLTAGSRVAIVGLLAALDISGAADGSGLVVGGFDSVAFTVVEGSSTVTLQSIDVTPANPGIGKGVSQQLTATGTFSDNSHVILNGQPGIAWTSSDPNKATINAFGLATGTGVGTATITATLRNISGSTQISVFPLQSIAVTPANQAIETGATQQFSATATFSNNSTADVTARVSWTSSNPGKATITGTGLLTGASVGLSTIVAALDGVASSTTVSVVPGFGPGVNYPNPFNTPSNPFNFFLGDTAIGDLNGDGRNDVAVIEAGFDINVPRRVLVYYRNAQGGFDSPQLITPSFEPKGIAVADVNNDGLADLLISGNSTTATSGFLGRVAVYLQDGLSHALGAPQELIPSTNNVGALAVADLNGDSLLDIITAGTGSGANGVISMFLQGPAGTLGAEVTYSNVPVVVDKSHGELHVADMNNDGLADIVVQSGDKEFAVVRQVSVGVFTATPDFYTVQTNYWSFFSSFALGDLNGDGLTDVAVGELTGNLNIFYQNANGTLVGPTILSSNQANEVHIADVDGDGLKDLVLLTNINRVQVLYQVDHSLSKARTYILPTQFSGGTPVHQALSVEDVTGDGLPDIVVSGTTEGIFVLPRAP